MHMALRAQFNKIIALSRLFILSSFSFILLWLCNLYANCYEKKLHDFIFHMTWQNCLKHLQNLFYGFNKMAVCCVCLVYFIFCGLMWMEVKQTPSTIQLNQCDYEGPEKLYGHKLLLFDIQQAKIVATMCRNVGIGT